MFRGYPKIAVVTKTAAEAAPVETKSEGPTKRITAADAIKGKTAASSSSAADAASKANAGVANVAPKDVTVHDVEVSLSAALKIAKHATENTRGDGAGHICGMQRDNTVHITNTFRLHKRENTRAPGDDDESMEYKKQENAACEQQEDDAKKALRGEFMDTFVVGNYTISSLGKHWFSTNIKKMLESVVGGAPGVLLNFDRTRSLMGKPYIRAYVLTDDFVAHAEKFMNRPRGFKPTPEDVDEERVSMITRKIFETDEGILREVPVSIKVSIPQQMLLRDMTPTPVVPSTSKAALTNQTEATFSSLIKTLVSTLGKIDEEPGMNKSATDAKLQRFIALQQAKEQAMYLESVCDSILLNIAVVRKV